MKKKIDKGGTGHMGQSGLKSPKVFFLCIKKIEKSDICCNNIDFLIITDAYIISNNNNFKNRQKVLAGKAATWARPNDPF